ncbi:DUF3794 domain-containing protein [Halanaerobacter jeridensis]|uniref:SipL SPOCS domain-containing protein n=1 Tax=Halanaerobacter jeridensis TaxID=706427 RepID=A0A939BMI8_9FIRM|nr:DUF3794 domain-containing protein [Halanaerobacter jeridensis]MBM7556625.1 hypothetical protein [Halanaerobacter jeridensis]
MACVLSDSIEIVGICEDFPNNCQGAFTQLKVPEIVEIPEQKPDIEQIIQVLVEGIVTNLKLIQTPVGDSVEGEYLTGEKLVIEGKVHQKIVYVAKTEEGDQPVHSAEFDIPFSTFIVVPDCYIGTVKPGKEDDINVQVCIEDVFIEEINPREVIKSSLLFINAIFPPEQIAPTLALDVEPTSAAPGDNIIIRVDVADNCLLDRIEIDIIDEDDNLVDNYGQSLQGENSAEVTHIWDTAILDPGEYTVEATVYDCAGNETFSTETVTLT